MKVLGWIFAGLILLTAQLAVMGYLYTTGYNKGDSVSTAAFSSTLVMLCESGKAFQMGNQIYRCAKASKL